jgi:hypothetical protein
LEEVIEREDNSRDAVESKVSSEESEVAILTTKNLYNVTLNSNQKHTIPSKSGIRRRK